MSEQALPHIRVIDLTHCVAGPYCTKLLSGFGAEVIKVEPPETGDKMRRLGPFYRDDEDLEHSIPFLWLNTGKQGITLDLKTEKGIEIIKNLVRDADVLVENFSPRVMPSLGLSYETLKEINPQLIMASISNFGQTGPYRDYKAEEIEMEALGGMMYLAGEPQRPPLTSGPSICQYSAGLHAYTGILMALFQRETNGRGQHVDVSILECALDNIEITMTNALHTGKNAKRGPHLGVPWDLYECEDGYALVIAMPARHWHRAAEIFEEPKLFDEKYDHIVDRVKHRKEFEDILRPSVKTHKKEALFHAGQTRNLAFGYVAGLDEVIRSPQHEEREFFVEIDHPAVGRQKYCGAPFKMSFTPWQSYRSPLLGEHNHIVYKDVLGYPPEEIDSLRRDRII